MISYRLVSHCKPLGPIISELFALLSLSILTWPWRRGPRSNLTTPKDLQPMIFYRLVSHWKPLGPIISDLLALLSLAILVWPWRRGPRHMISYRLVSHCKPLGPIIREKKNACGSHLVFQNFFSQDFVMMNISCEFEISTYNALCSREPIKLLAESQNAHGGHLVFQNKAKNIPRQDFMVMNISCKFEKSTYNILASRGVMRKSLHAAAAA